MMTFARVCLTAMVVMTLGSCVRHQATVIEEKRAPVVATEEHRTILVTGEVFAIPAEIQTPTSLVTGAMMGERELLDFEAIPSYHVQSLLHPKLKATNDVSARFKLVFEGAPDFITISMKPHIQTDGQVALGARIEASSADGSVDHLETDRLVRPNADTFSIFGPLRLDNQMVFVALKTDVQP